MYQKLLDLQKALAGDIILTDAEAMQAEARMNDQFTPKEQEARRKLLRVALCCDDNELVMQWQPKRK